MNFICTDVVKHPGTIIMIFEPQPMADGVPMEKFNFKSATVTGAKLVAVDPYGVITILYDPEAENLPTFSAVDAVIGDIIDNLYVIASDEGLFEPGTTLADAV